MKRGRLLFRRAAQELTVTINVMDEQANRFATQDMLAGEAPLLAVKGVARKANCGL